MEGEEITTTTARRKRGSTLKLKYCDLCGNTDSNNEDHHHPDDLTQLSLEERKDLRSILGKVRMKNEELLTVSTLCPSCCDGVDSLLSFGRRLRRMEEELKDKIRTLVSIMEEKRENDKRRGRRRIKNKKYVISSGDSSDSSANDDKNDAGSAIWEEEEVKQDVISDDDVEEESGEVITVKPEIESEEEEEDGPDPFSEFGIDPIPTSPGPADEDKKFRSRSTTPTLAPEGTTTPSSSRHHDAGENSSSSSSDSDSDSHSSNSRRSRSSCSTCSSSSSSSEDNSSDSDEPEVEMIEDDRPVTKRKRSEKQNHVSKRKCVNDSDELLPEVKVTEVCGSCTKAFVNEEDLQSHLKENDHHPPTDEYDRLERLDNANERLEYGAPFMCICDEYYPTKQKRDRHFRFHHLGYSDWKCNICNLLFWTEKEMQRHLTSLLHRKKVMEIDGLPCLPKPEPKAKSNICDICGKKYVKKYRLLNHKFNVHGEGEAKYFCTHCGKGFRLLENLRAHVKSVHETSYTCEICNIPQGNYLALLSHKTEAHPPDPSTWVKCPQCPDDMNITYAPGDGLKKHIMLRHDPQRLQELRTCKVCKLEFPSMRDKDIHYRKDHLGRPVHKCEKCGKEFLSAGDLGSHLVRHTEEKSCICDKCGKSFKRIATLHKHRITVCGDNPETAALFRQRSNERGRIHAMVGKNCPVCGRKFRTTSHIKRHMKSAHPEEYEQMENQKTK